VDEEISELKRGKKKEKKGLGKRKRKGECSSRALTRRVKVSEDSDTQQSEEISLHFKDNLELLKGFGNDLPTYCYCNSVYYDDMIGCDGKDCEIEWFHFACVSLKNKPEGKWFCPDCIKKMK